jgi:hypothetical protein
MGVGASAARWRLQVINIVGEESDDGHGVLDMVRRPLEWKWAAGTRRTRRHWRPEAWRTTDGRDPDRRLIRLCHTADNRTSGQGFSWGYFSLMSEREPEGREQPR